MNQLLSVNKFKILVNYISGDDGIERELELGGNLNNAIERLMV